MAQGVATPPAGHIAMAEAVRITGYQRDTLTKWFREGAIPGAIQHRPHAPIYFTEAGLRAWLGIDEPPDEAGVAC
jgi:hypothetical protein